MRLFKRFKVDKEYREFMYLYQADTKQEILDFLNEFRQYFNRGDLYRISHKKSTKQFYLWDARGDENGI